MTLFSVLFVNYVRILKYNSDFLLIKVREGRRAAIFLKLCVFLHYTAISEHI